MKCDLTMVSLQSNRRHEGEQEECAEDDRPDLKRLHSRDEAAFERLYEKYEMAAYRVAMAIAKHHQDVENIVQETFKTLFEMPPVPGEDKTLQSWVVRVARNKALDLLRKRKRQNKQTRDIPDDLRDDPISLIPDEMPTPPDTLIEEETRNLIRTLVNDIPNADLRSAAQYFVTAQTAEELALRNDVPLPTMKARIARAREAITPPLKHYLLSH